MPELASLTKTEPLSTASATYDIRRLEGPHVTMTPYSRGFYRRDLAYQLWALMEKEGAIDLVFYETPTDPEAKAAHGDLAEFVSYFSDPNKIVLIAQDNESGEIAGMTWFEIQCGRFRALGNWWVRRKFWGQKSREIGIISCDYIFKNIGVPAIWGYSPWLTSVKSAESYGFDYVVALPGYSRAKGQVTDIHIVCLTAGRFAEGRYYENLYKDNR